MVINEFFVGKIESDRNLYYWERINGVSLLTIGKNPLDYTEKLKIKIKTPADIWGSANLPLPKGPKIFTQFLPALPHSIQFLPLPSAFLSICHMSRTIANQIPNMIVIHIPSLLMWETLIHCCPSFSFLPNRIIYTFYRILSCDSFISWKG